MSSQIFWESVMFQFYFTQLSQDQDYVQFPSFSD